jgi:hypothetical protein
MQAPTLGEILARDWSLAVSCERCRILTLVDARGLARGRPVATRIDALRFRCRRCGAAGAPIVDAPGNMLLGRPQVWPPVSDKGQPADI